MGQILINDQLVLNGSKKSDNTIVALEFAISTLLTDGKSVRLEIIDKSDMKTVHLISPGVLVTTKRRSTVEDSNSDEIKEALGEMMRTYGNTGRITLAIEALN